MSVRLRSCRQYFSTFCAKGFSYCPALNKQATAAAEIAGRGPPPDLLLYWMPPLGVAQLSMYLIDLSMISFGTGMPALRHARSPCTWVIVVEPSSKSLPSFALT